MAALTATADWKALFAHWTAAIGVGELEALGELGEASLERLVGATGQAGLGLRAAQAAMGHDQAGGFAVLYYLLALRGVEALQSPSWLVGPEALEASPQVSVIVPVHNRWLLTLNCLRSVLTAHTTVRCEVLLADDASSDATVDLAARNPWLQLVRSEQNLGFLDNCNHAAQAARGEVLVLLNNDTLVGDQWLDRLWSTLQRHPDAGVVGSQVYGPDGTVQESGGILWADGEVWNHGRGFGRERWFELDHAREVDYVSGCALAIRRPLWEQLGGFDPAYRPAYAEDTDLCLRVRQSGSTVMVQPHSRILHLEGLSHSRSGEGGLKRYQSVNLEKLRQRWRPVLMTEQPTDRGLPLLASDRGLRRGPVVLLLEPCLSGEAGKSTLSSAELIEAFQELGFKVLLLPEWNGLSNLARLGLEQRGVLCLPAEAAGEDRLGWLAHQVPQLDAIVTTAVNSVVSSGAARVTNLLTRMSEAYPIARVIQAHELEPVLGERQGLVAHLQTLLPELIHPRSLRVPVLCDGAVACDGLELLAGSRGLHADGWLEVDSLLVMALGVKGNKLRIDLYRPELNNDGTESILKIVMGWNEVDSVSLHHRLTAGLNSFVISASDQGGAIPEFLSLQLSGPVCHPSAGVSDQRCLLAVLSSLAME